MSFLRNLFRRRTKEVDISICGLANAGKTTIVKYLETGRYYRKILRNRTIC
ncbi:MAG: ADP-ribosylation factor-like protein [Candidatus Heimdallarchaeota archaeon]